MANSVDKGTQVININFKQNLASRNQNKAFYGVIPKGIYSGGELSIVGNVARLAPMVAYIKDIGNSLSLKVETTSNYDVSEMTSTLPYVVCEFDWVDAENSYMDIRAVAIPASNHLIIGKGLYTGTTLTGFDLSERDTAFLPSLSQKGDVLTLNADKVIIDGDLTVSGSQEVEVSDEIITVNSGQIGTPSVGLLGGLEIERGDETNFQIVFRESDDVLTTGLVGSLKRVATLEDVPKSEGISFWNDTNKTLDTTSGLVFEQITTDPQLSLLRTTGVSRLSFGELGDKFQAGLEFNGNSILLYPDFNGGSPRLALHPTNGFQVNGTVNQWGLTNSGDDLIIKDVTESHSLITMKSNEKKVIIDGTLEVTGAISETTLEDFNKLSNLTYLEKYLSPDLVISINTHCVAYDNRKRAIMYYIARISSTYYIAYVRTGSSGVNLLSNGADPIRYCVTLGIQSTASFDQESILVVTDTANYILSTNSSTLVAIPGLSFSGIAPTASVRDIGNNRLFLLDGSINSSIKYSTGSNNFQTWITLSIGTGLNYYKDITYNPDTGQIVCSKIELGIAYFAVSDSGLTSFTEYTYTLPTTSQFNLQGKQLRYFKGKYFFLTDEDETGYLRIYESTDAISWALSCEYYKESIVGSSGFSPKGFVSTGETLYVFTNFPEVFYNENGTDWYVLNDVVNPFISEALGTIQYHRYADKSFISNPTVKGGDTSIIPYANTITGTDVNNATKLN